MKFTIGWLKDHLDTQASVADIAEKLTALGLEVDAIEDPTAALAPFVVGHVIEAGPHPDADRLKLCRVDSGTDILQIVCGAPNARTGLKVALALPGAVIPATGDVLKKGKIRGIESQGMMCSTRELGLGEDHDGIIELPADTPVGVPLVDVLALDPVIDIAITPNRADALGVRGIARDLAAGGLGGVIADTLTAIPGRFPSPIGVAIDPETLASGACSHYVGRYFRGVRNGESPAWLKDRLNAIGVRPISLLVDITNYVTFDRARPLHVFDADKLTGTTITARPARQGEILRALDGRSYTLDAPVVAIADGAGPQGLGGIMGGEDTGVDENTVNVFLESALFDPANTAAAGRFLGIDSDARYRFERGVDPESCLLGAELATRMILDLCGGEASELVIAGAPPVWRRTIALRPARVARLGGVAVERAEMVAKLRALGCTVEDDGAEALRVDPPSWRVDIGAEHDLIEEVVRLHGFDLVPAVPLPRDPMPKAVLTPGQRRMITVKRTLATRGMLEAVTWSFLPRAVAKGFGGGQDALVLANPISSDLDAMRPSILPNLIAAAGRNAARGYGDLGLFEVGPRFHGGEPGQQTLVAAGLRAGKIAPRHWSRPARDADLYDIKADVLAAIEAAGAPTASLQVSADAPAWFHPGRSGQIRLGRTVLAAFGEIHPAALALLDVKGPMVGFELDLDALPLPKGRPSKTRPPLTLSPFQPVARDFAFVVEAGVAGDAVIKAARGADKALITDVVIFDVYQGDRLEAGRKSLALSVTLQPTDHTLSDEEIEAVSARIVGAVTKLTGGSLRS
ncbi:phenylalanine--tRNA ligase subunit beta [Rhodospirillum rubrum]|uniref:Phenylalanine--tRNA ligase beta subunit n=1 Tax=Rhodospirillum rubrum (strain ATCC 11170 / ATH 1.1.1 / DSM 467 / LMG 4362 / NCIMB 8255 / S1) TaxID=269796 RepID=SYFB_RHORT|nr:phenylalanine--tRNA ligase subunit beta [Rhodospirillum rubrum]Q2RNH7.1 RecName: Full=Phenylalanine--tRNA ligase beta subunit; AltName: Full=Phenylalanyl-tRNA synthetase beta subunit; Short=PheRS [Rhodospirillum rubrum ATCC 11170]ABC24318.1 phenylalanyl-tRNA synthetase beta subunit [Rhodospirillum rubrum ATCC 11170]AEO50069.1 phenylalanyl-tRNA synthetase subunit beta [Rhodospirillum rubrum F11]MBK5956037.1 phenylalanine--tRNA ligase subunit beta [Rhodospirillum rubrum]QXG80245.1 phenylalani